MAKRNAVLCVTGVGSGIRLFRQSLCRFSAHSPTDQDLNCFSRIIRIMHPHIERQVRGRDEVGSILGDAEVVDGLLAAGVGESLHGEPLAVGGAEQVPRLELARRGVSPARGRRRGARGWCGACAPRRPVRTAAPRGRIPPRPAGAWGWRCPGPARGARGRSPRRPCRPAGGFRSACARWG